MTLQELAMADQRDIELTFSACAYMFPLIALKNAGWLPPALMIDERLRNFWGRVKDRVVIDMGEDRAAEMVNMIAMESGVLRELMTEANDNARVLGMAGTYAQEIAQRAYNVKVLNLLPTLTQSLREHDHQTVKELLVQIASEHVPATRSARTSIDVHDAFMEFLHSETLLVVPTGISNLDESLGGWPKRNLSVIGARPSMGKTALAWQSARDAAQAGNRVYFVSLEMGEIDLWMRAACPPADVLCRDVISRRLTVDQMRKLRESSELLKEFYGTNLVIEDKPQSSESIWQYATANRPDLIVVDHLRLLRDRNIRGELEAKRQGRIAENLKEISKSCNSAVLCLAQLNRGVEARSDKRPGLSDLRDSGEIEENADVIAFIHSPDYYDTTTGYKPSRSIELWIDKNRNGGRLIQVNLIYNLRQQTFVPAQVSKVKL